MNSFSSSLKKNPIICFLLNAAFHGRQAGWRQCSEMTAICNIAAHQTPGSLQSVPPAPISSSGVLWRQHSLYNFTTNWRVNISSSAAQLFPSHKSSCERTLSLQTSNKLFFGSCYQFSFKTVDEY